MHPPLFALTNLSYQHLFPGQSGPYLWSKIFFVKRCWTDSWISGNPRGFKTYVTNRVIPVDGPCLVPEWRHATCNQPSDEVDDKVDGPRDQEKSKWTQKTSSP